MSAPVGPEEVEVVSELGHVLLKRLRMRKSRVQEHEGLARAVLLLRGYLSRRLFNLYVEYYGTSAHVSSPF